MNWADLHIHSNYSDGSQTVENIFKQAAKRKIDTISITDHDTVDGIEESNYWADKCNISYIPGIEISAYDFNKNSKVHILGYNFSSYTPNIKKICDPILEQRNNNTQMQINILKEAGYPITLNEVEKEANGAKVLYKQHIMKVLVNKGLTQSIYSDLYKKLFQGRGICNIDIEYVDANLAVEAIVKDGGQAVLAHPGIQNSFDLVPSLVKKGLWGIELHHEGNNHSDRVKIQQIAKTYNLQLTGGSDTHGVLGSTHSLGDIIAPHTLCFPQKRDVPKRVKVAKNIIIHCGDILYSVQVEKEEQSQKENNHTDLVTIYDISTERKLVQTLKNEFPDDGFITEEDETVIDSIKGYVWIIDPIDGTTNFIHQKEHFSISVACYLDGKPYFGLVYDVMNKKMYEGISGIGAWVNNKKILKNNKRRKLKESLGDFSLNSISMLKNQYNINMCKLNNRILGHRSLGSASLIICQISQGKTDFYISVKLKLWDYAAAIIILHETGGSFVVNTNINIINGLREKRVFLATSNSIIMTELKEFFHNNKLELCKEDITLT